MHTNIYTHFVPATKSHSVSSQNRASGIFLEMTDLLLMSGEEGSPRLCVRVCVSVLCIQYICVGEFWLNGGSWQSSALFSLVANIRGPARHVMETLEI